MNVTPEKGRGTTGQGRPIGPDRRNLSLGWLWFRTRPFSSRFLSFFGEGNRLIPWPNRGIVRRVGFFIVSPACGGVVGVQW